MSAYGPLSRPARARLAPTSWTHPSPSHPRVTLFHLDAPECERHPGLFDHLHAVFADEVDAGRTYPQEDMRDPGAFRAYFFAGDVVLAIAGAGGDVDGGGDGTAAPDGDPRRDGAVVEVDLETATKDRSWNTCVVGFYYVKPNYPGRSSHICNAGFVVPPSHRGHGYGRVLARSFLYYAPRLGYDASVFNLVYVNNAASVRLWESLGFVKAGLIPRAGRLRRADGQGEEYVDAWVFYKRFDEGQDARGQ